jgi:hypothetical protein
VVKHSKWVIQNQDFSNVATFISVYRSDFLSRLKQDPSSRLVEEIFRQMHDMGLTRKPSCHKMRIGLWDNKETMANFKVSTILLEKNQQDATV